MGLRRRVDCIKETVEWQSRRAKGNEEEAE
jgi:hypothetical protein